MKNAHGTEGSAFTYGVEDKLITQMGPNAYRVKRDAKNESAGHEKTGNAQPHVQHDDVKRQHNATIDTHRQQKP